MILLALIFALDTAGAAARSDAPERPDLSDPAVKARVQLDVLEGLYRAGMLDEALRAAGDIRSQGVKDPRLDILQARVMSAKGMRSEATAMLEGVTRKHRRNAEAWAALGIIHADEERIAESLDALQKAAKFAPNDADVRNNLGFVQMAAGRYDDAIDTFKAAIALDPSEARTRNNLGFALARADRDSDALEAFRSAGSEADARYNLGVACELRMDVTSALAQYQAALQSQPEHPQAKAALARLLHEESP